MISISKQFVLLLSLVLLGGCASHPPIIQIQETTLVRQVCTPETFYREDIPRPYNRDIYTAIAQTNPILAVSKELKLLRHNQKVLSSIEMDVQLRRYKCQTLRN